jgi:predicted enzyme related to lactoylglutathione lyase
MPHHFDWLEFRSADNTATKAFYTQAFGWEFMDFGDNYVFAMPGGDGAPGCGFRMGSPEGTPQTVAYINTLDIDQSIADVQGAGGTLVVEKFEVPQVGFVAFFKDPTGNIVGLHQSPADHGHHNGEPH